MTSLAISSPTVTLWSMSPTPTHYGAIMAIRALSPLYRYAMCRSSQASLSSPKPDISWFPTGFTSYIGRNVRFALPRTFKMS